jgi:hypothetical protein
MNYWCCLCETGKSRAGRIRNGGGVPICAEHFAEGYWRSRQPQAPQVVTWPPSPEEAYQRAMALAALAQTAITG